MQIYLAVDGQQAGPFSEQDLQAMLAQGKATPSQLAWHDGLPDWVPLGEVMKPILELEKLPPPMPLGSQATSEPLYFYIPIERLVLMSLLTFNLYDSLWHYRQWSYLKKRDGLDISPFWRAFFGIFFMHSLLESIHADRAANRLVTPTFSPGPLALGWVLLMLVGNISGRIDAEPHATILMIISAPAFLFLLPVQRYINSVNASLPSPPKHHDWSWGQVLLLVLGFLLWLLMLVGLMLPEETGSVGG